MEFEVAWRIRASRDLDALIEYLTRHNPDAAVRYVEDIQRRCKTLASMPFIGRRYGRFRVLVVRNHLVFYQINEEHRIVTVTAVIDARRDLEAILTYLDPH